MSRLVMEENALNRISLMNLKNSVSLPPLAAQSDTILPPLAKKQKNSNNNNINRSAMNPHVAKSKPSKKSSKKNGQAKKCSLCKAKGRHQPDHDKHRLYSKKCPFYDSSL